MKKSKIIYTVFHKGSAIFMILTLLWLTISTPFVFAAQQEQAKHKMEHSKSPVTGNNDEDSNNPLGSNTEEKVPNAGPNVSEEYLHDHHITHHYFVLEDLQYHKCENADTYIAFHGELLVPPPNAA